MEVKSIILEQVGGFERLEISLAPNESSRGNVTILVGDNGSGKTSVLRALATSLSWLVARIRAEKGNGSPIPEEVIRLGSNSASTTICVQDKPHYRADTSTSYEWTLAKSRKGRKGDKQSDLGGVTRLAVKYRGELFLFDEDCSLPLIAFYPVERVVLDIPLKIRSKHSFLQLDGYDNSLNQGVDFRRFFEWFREREDAENESGISPERLDELFDKLPATDTLWEELQKIAASSRDRQLTAVRSAIEAFMPGFKNLKVRRKPRLFMSIDKNGETLNVLQLSQGEKSLIALAGDVARRLAMMNPELTNPLEGDGIVLIDEVDLHLHPKWQRKIVSHLTNTFPNCQFVLTTHSPLVISDSRDVLTYLIDQGKQTRLDPQYGADANSVLLDVMDTDIRNPEVNLKLSNILDHIHEGDLNKAEDLMDDLEWELPADNMELDNARRMLRMRKRLSAKNN